MLEMYRRIDLQGWAVIAAVGAGNVLLVVAGMYASALLSLIFLGLAGFIWTVHYQLSRSMLNDTLEIAKDLRTSLYRERDFSREVVEECVEVLRDLNRYDVQRSGVHTARLRETIVKHHPDLEFVISEVEQPVNVPGFII